MYRPVHAVLTVLGAVAALPTLPGSLRPVEAAPVSTTATLAQKESLLHELSVARAYALKAIYDDHLYPESTNPNSPGQREVDRRVDHVKTLYARFEPLLEADVTRLRHETAAQRKAFLAKPDAKLNPWQRAVRRRYRDELIQNHNDALTHATTLPEHGVKPTALEAQQARITNDYRMLMGRAALPFDTRLVHSARAHSEEMVRLNYFAHGSPVAAHDTLEKRFALEGLHPLALGENIAYGSGSYGTPEGTQDLFYHSAGHHQNLLRRGWTHFGIGRALKNDPTYGAEGWWTQDYDGDKITN
jgi:uncharacterized protein YkwD